MPGSKVSGAFLVLGAAVLWGTTGTSQALAPSGATPPVIGALRLVVGGLILLGYAALRGSFRNIRGLMSWTLAGAAVFIAAYQVLFFSGVARAGVAVGTIVGIGSAPIWGGIFGILFAGERPGKAWFIATLLAISGSVLLGMAQTSEFHVDLPGLVMAVGAGCAYAGFTLFNKRLLMHYPPEGVQAAIFILGGGLLLPLLVGADLNWLTNPKGLLVVGHLGFVTVGLAYTLFSLGLQRVPISNAVTLTLAEPMTAGLLGVLLLGERLPAVAWLGIMLIFSGLAVLVAGRKAE